MNGRIPRSITGNKRQKLHMDNGLIETAASIAQKLYEVEMERR